MRSAWKLPYINPKYFERCFLKKRTFVIRYKNSIISSNFKDKKVSIYTGKYFYSFIINSNMIGYKFGEFVNYKTFAHYVHIKKDKNRMKKNK